ncbi:MAG TPA: DNA-binding transcriptional regulator [Candidatus Paceibacterota bacterium]|nr:DNA-binding transcriptional regulator [Candidatus Paceibacterota bacterium]
MRKTPRRVLLALGWYDYRLHCGIEKYAQEQGWHLCSDVTKEKVIPWGWEGDGILSWLGAGEDLADFVVKAKLPTVDFSFRRPQLLFPRVLVDHEIAARLAAEQFISRGFTNFLFYSGADNWAFEENGRGFVRATSEAGFQCRWIRWHQAAAYTLGKTQWKEKRKWLRTELKNAPKPLAVFAANDDHALEILEICEDARLAVPEQVSIIGMDNSLLAVDAMRTPVSSIDTNLEMVGYRGAELLDRMMRGTTVSLEPIRIQPTGLITRKSSDLIAVNHPGVARGLRFLIEHCHEMIGVDDIARAAAMSRRGLHRAFLENLGRPPGQELQRIRIERAKKVLVQTDQKMEAIANLCGYQNANSFWSAFRLVTGMSPNEYRRQFLKNLSRKTIEERE